MKMLAGYAKNAIKNLAQQKRRLGLKRSIIGPRFGVLVVTVVVLVIFPLFAPRSFAASIGPNSPTIASGTSWTNAANVYSNNSAYASYALSSGATSSALNVTGFGFNISSSATIDGVQVSVMRYAPSVSRSAVTDGSIYLLKGGVTTGTSQASATTWPTTNGAAMYGGSAALWGASLTPSDVNASSFGVAITATNTKTGGNGGSNTAYIDYVSVTVSYTLNNTFTQASYRLYDNQDASSDVSSSVSFAAKTDYATGFTPQSVAAGDFNSDGYSDFAVANSGDANVSVLLGTGSGTFNPKVDYPLGASDYPYAIRTSDFNGDGKLDLAVTDSNGVAILLGTGTGSFGSYADYGTGTYPYDLTIADFNGDGKKDVAVVNYEYGDFVDISVLLGTGTGTLGTANSYTLVTGTGSGGAQSYGVTAADFNGDGKLDLAATDEPLNAVSVLLGSGTGTFGASTDYPTGDGPESVTAGDFNGDGHVDLATADDYDGAVSVLLGTGTGSFGAKTSYATGAYAFSVATTDFNGDGKLDLAVANNSNLNTISVLLGTGSGTFGNKQDLTTGPSPIGVATADFNGDNRQDIVTANSAGDNVSVLLNSGASAAIDVGSPLAAQNTPAAVQGDGQPFRLRMDIGVANADLPANGQAFKLQYAPMAGTCSATSGYSDVTDTSTVRYYDNSLATNSTAMVTNANDPTDGTNTVIPQTYQEKGTTTFTNSAAIPAGQDGMWDFALTTGGAAGGQHYCMRMVGSSGTPLTTYSAIPEIIAPPPTLSQSSYRFFEDSSATVPTTRAWGGTGSDTGTSIVATADGGYAISGGTSGVAFLAKYDKKDNLTWSHAISGAGGSSLIATDDGGYAISSSTSSYGSGGSDMILTKYDSSGNLSWSRTWGGAGGDESYALAQTTDGGYALAGDSLGSDGSVDVAVVKYDSSGNLQWAHTWGVGGSGFDYALAIVATSDGGIALTGPTAVTGNNDMFLLKYDSSGGLTWTRTWGGALPDKGNSLVQNSDGGYTVAGETYNYGGGNTDMFLARYNSSGTLQWSRTWGGAGSDTANSVAITSDGGYAMTGWTDGYGAGGHDMVLARYNSSGTLQWSRTWGGTGNDSGSSVAQIADGGYAVTGSTDSYGAGGMDVLLARYASDGSMLNCAAPMCQSPTANTTSPTASTTSPAANTASPVATTTSPSLSMTPLTLTTTSIVAGTTVAAGNPLVPQNTAVNVDLETPFRLRSRIAVDSGNLQQSGQSFKLQYKERTSGVCNPNATGYADIMAIGTAGSSSGYAATATELAGSGNSWSPLGAATGTPDGSTASAYVGNQQTDYFTNTLRLTNYPISVPAGATITGITATISGNKDSNSTMTGFSAVNTATGKSLDMRSSTNFTTGNPVTYGSSTNAGNFTASDVSDSNFGVSLNFESVGSSTGTVYIDAVQITVYYSSGGSSDIAYYDNPALSDGTSIAATVDDPTNGARAVIPQSYRETGPFTNNAAAIPASSDGLWDFALTSSAAADGKIYCLRLVKSDGSLLDSYVQIPEITVGTPAPTGPTLEQQLRGGQGVVNGVKTPFMF